MSNWTHINGWIQLDGIKREGIIESHKLRKNISEEKYDEYMNNYKNFEYKFVDKWGIQLVINYEKEVKEVLKKIETPSGSEGGTEYCLGTYPNHYKIWKSGNWSGSRDWDKKQERLVSERYKEIHDEKDVEMISETSIGDFSKLFIYGDLRDREYETTKEEFINYVEELRKYFRVLDLDVTISFNGESESRCRLEFDKNYKDYLSFEVIDKIFTFKKRLFKKDEYKEKCKIKKRVEKVYLSEEE